MSVALIVYFAIMARYGSTRCAAYAIGVRLLAFSWLLAGLRRGGGDPGRQALGARRTTKLACGMAAMVSALTLMAGLGVGLRLLARAAARVFTHDPELSRAAVTLPARAGDRAAVMACTSPFQEGFAAQAIR